MTGDSEREGAVFWITGLSGSGKTTAGELFFKRLQSRYANSVFLDGDPLRAAIAEDLGYSVQDRLKCAFRYGRLGRLLAAQGVYVVVATISMFSECRRWNRQNIPGYREIYLKTPLGLLRRRNAKGLYSEACGGETVGVDLPFEEPENPDLTIENDGSKSPEQVAEEIWWRLRP